MNGELHLALKAARMECARIQFLELLQGTAPALATTWRRLLAQSAQGLTLLCPFISSLASVSSPPVKTFFFFPREDLMSANYILIWFQISVFFSPGLLCILSLNINALKRISGISKQENFGERRFFPWSPKVGTPQIPNLIEFRNLPVKKSLKETWDYCSLTTVTPVIDNLPQIHFPFLCNNTRFFSIKDC